MSAKPKADECPWCQFTDQWIWEPGPDLKAVACGNKGCNATGPVRDTEDDAIRQWNAAPRR